MSAYTPAVSFNFSVAKVAAILLVVSGHYFSDSLLWIPVTMGLFLFAYASGRFTSSRYAGNLSLKTFWWRKLVRLGVPFILVQIFLLLLFVAQGRDGILSWHTLVHWTGASGFLNWFGVADQSPFGAGMWFFTLLLIFYLTFPFLSGLAKNRGTALVVTVAGALAAVVLTHEVQVGHVLWITMFGFWLGVYADEWPLPGSAFFWILVLRGAVAALLVSNLWGGFRALNMEFIFLAAVGLVQTLERITLPRRVFAPLLVLSPALLEIYLLHPYLLVRSDAVPVRWGYAASMVLTVTVALVLSRMSLALTARRG